jgi:hypothetical protein
VRQIAEEAKVMAESAQKKLGPLADPSGTIMSQMAEKLRDELAEIKKMATETKSAADEAIQAVESSAVSTGESKEDSSG